MKFSINILSLLLLILLLSNCVSEFNAPSEGYEDLLVVDAFLTDGDERFQVHLSRSFPIDTFEITPESGALVRLLAESGEMYDLQEISNNGSYESIGAINPQVGMSYKLIIQTKGGDNYESAEVKMRATPEIDSIVYKQEDQPTAGLQGVQIYANTHDPNNSTWFYRWEWEESWEFIMPYDPYLVWEDDEIQVRQDRTYRCWKYGTSSSIAITSSKNLVQDRISDYPLLYVTNETDRLNRRYSLLVKQYGLNEEAYNYWKELRDITENLGTLFDPQPSIVLGNIRNIDNQTEVVLGYFDAASVSEQRIFVERGQLSEIVLPEYFAYCTDSIVTEGQIPEMVSKGWFLIGDTQTPTGFPAYNMTSESCIDCRLYGSIERPDYW